MSTSDFQRFEIMNPSIVSRVREQIAIDIQEAAHAGPPNSELEEYWVAGMMYAVKIAKGE